MTRSSQESSCQVVTVTSNGARLSAGLPELIQC